MSLQRTARGRGRGTLDTAPPVVIYMGHRDPLAMSPVRADSFGRFHGRTRPESLYSLERGTSKDTVGRCRDLMLHFVDIQVVEIE